MPRYLVVALLLASSALQIGIVEAISVLGAGSTLPDTMLQAAFFAYRFVAPNVSMQYSGTTTAKGLCRLESHANRCDPTDLDFPRDLDYATSGASIADADYALYPDLQLYPVLATAVVPIYNLGNVQDLTLSPTTLAQIYRGNITHWDDPRILADNPNSSAWGLPAGQRITVVVRSDVAAVTQVWKEALASFEAAFEAQVPADQSAVWPNVTVVGKSGLLGMNAYVMLTPYTIGYSVLGDAVDGGLAVAMMRRGTNVIAASSTSIEHAIMELGSSFGNDGSDASRLTANLYNAAGLNSWPICNYVYVVLRKTTVRNGTTCQQMAANVAFWKWFLNAEVVRNLTHKHSQGSMPEVVRDEVLARLVADMSCDGETVDVVEQTTGLIGQGEQPMEVLFNKFADTYSLVDTAAYVYYNSTTEAALADEADPLASYAFLVTGVPSPNTSNDFSLPFAVLGVSLISACSLILDGLTIAKILDGRITTWLDPAIVALNPGGITDTAGQNLTNRTQSIVLLRGPVGAVEMLTDVLRSYDESYTGAAITTASRYPTDSVLITAVVGTPYSLAVTTLAGSYSSQVRVAQFQRTDGTVVAPSWSSLQACASKDAFDPVSRTFSLPHSTSSACYPLCQALYLRVRKSKCDAIKDAARTRTVAFVEWLFSGAAVDSALQGQNLAPLRTNAQVIAANALVLDTITCTPKAPLPKQSDEGPLVFIIVGAAGGVLVLLGTVGGWWYWRSTEEMRAMRKQFSNDNVAQECAAAIARFDLEAVAWLSSVENLNKIQSSFLKIIHLLTEVKPFIPDQLLTSLTEQDKDDVGEALNECGPLIQTLRCDDEDDTSSMDQHRDSRYSRATVETMASGDGTVRNQSTILSVSFPTIARKRNGSSCTVKFRDRGRSRISTDGFHRASVAPRSQQWVLKRCTYLCIKFGFEETLDNPLVLNEMGAITSALVVCCKKHGATIDKVSYNTVAVHWGVASSVKGSSTNAALAAVEAQQLPNTVSEQLRSCFWMRIAIGFGSCFVATLSAGGHSFFVVCGDEVALPIDLVTTDVHSKCKCITLISPAVYKEVQFSIKCFPRVFANGQLLWEPVERCPERADEEEWMYELRKMDEQGKAEFGWQTLYRVFMMAYNGDQLSDIQRAVELVRGQHASHLSEKDIACLDHLLASIADDVLHLNTLTDV
eukprot:GGOE01035901.1.p1 GENE.GGOE01035901.1~~GGOE01035901.1.p1  ORF type:complete len:1183 (-),score=452.26 GGOE01035901.1:856-4380(-)